MEVQFSKKALERFDAPRNYDELEVPDGHAKITGPCGDTMEFWLHVDDGILSAVSFTTTGCGPSRACGSMATELATGKTPDEAARIEQKDILDALGGLPDEWQHCALLASNTLKAAIADYHETTKNCTNENDKAEKKCSSCDSDTCSAKTPHEGEAAKDFLERQALQQRMCRIKHKVLVLSGKGGVGKSTVAVNLAVSLSLAGKRVGLLDVDVHGPSIPKMLHIENAPVLNGDHAILPVESGNMKVMSIGFFLPKPDEAVIWRGPMKMGVIKQFLKDADWGELDYLVIDSPPGTGDEPLSICQLIENADGAVIVTTPQEISIADVRRSINFCHKLELPVLGVVENMSGFVCPHCGKTTDVFKTGGGERMANEMAVPFLGCIPLDPQVGEACDSGTPYVQHYARTETAKAFERVIKPILALSTAQPPANKEENSVDEITQKENKTMRIAIPVADGKLAMHFGHCEQFILIDAEPATKNIVRKEMVDAPEHQPGLLPRWLAERGAQVIIAGGMGSRAQSLFAEHRIQVVTGAPAHAPEELVTAYLAQTLETGDNVCDH